MQHLNSAELTQLFAREGNKILKTVRKKPKVIETADKHILKVFYPKHKWYYFLKKRTQPALAFCQNAKQLNSLSVVAPEIAQLSYCAESKVYVVKYPKIPATSVNQLIKECDEKFVQDLAKFLVDLHEKGIFFRSIHLENIMYTGKDFTLIDISDVRFKRTKLSAYLRYRNLHHFLTYHKYVHVWTKERLDAFVVGYLKKMHLTGYSARYLMKRLLRLNEEVNGEMAKA